MAAIIDGITEYAGPDSELCKRMYASTVRVCKCNRCGCESTSVDPMPFLQVNFSDLGYGVRLLDDLMKESVNQCMKLDCYECEQCTPMKVGLTSYREGNWGNRLNRDIWLRPSNKC